MKIQIKRNGVVASEITITTITRYHNEFQIKYIRTHESYRGRGFASRLIEKAKAKYPAIVAFLDDDGSGLTVKQMEAWYLRHGFKKRRFSFGEPWDRGFKKQNVMYWEAK